MKILYIANCQSSESYNSFLKLWNKSLNTSNQVFHNKMIRCLSLIADITVFSIRPLNKNCNVNELKEGYEQDNNIEWIYPKIKKNKILRLSYLKSSLKQLLQETKFDYIFVDSINFTCLYTVFGNKAIISCPIISVCTDIIRNISYTNSYAVKRIKSMSNKSDGYICLTSKINDYYNKDKKPYLIFEGLVENSVRYSQNKYGKYFFYSGTLLEKYGIQKLINSFKKLTNSEVKLIIAGHHNEYNRSFYSSIQDERIKFLGTLSNEEVLSLEHHAIACINPRPSSCLDEESIPSKVLEYLANCKLTISFENPILRNIFNKEILWVDSGNEDDLKLALEKAINGQDHIVLNANKKVNSLYSLTEISKRINTFLENI